MNPNSITALTKTLAENEFTNRLRNEAHFDDRSYSDLLRVLADLGEQLKKEESLPKALALDLYVIPQVVRNLFLAAKAASPDGDTTRRLEDAWTELDALVIECLAD
jgi:hypothetical protein